MVATARTIEVLPGSELDRILAEANGASLVLVRDGVRYRLQQDRDEDDIWANYDPEQVKQVLAEVAGAWKNIDTEALKADLRAQRGHDDESA